MAEPVFASGEMLLAFLVFSDGQGSKRRPVLVVHDFGDADLLVVPVTTHPARVATDVVLSDWRATGLKRPSTVRIEKLATIAKIAVARKLGVHQPADRAKVKETLRPCFGRSLPNPADDREREIRTGFPAPIRRMSLTG